MTRECRKHKREQSQARGDERKDKKDANTIAIDNGDVIIV